MVRMERRQTPRMAVQGLAYVNLEPDNGGTVLNISEGGLCFHSATPVRRPTTVRFWFAQRYPGPDSQLARTNDPQMRSGSRFIEAESVLAWTDEKRKIGGLRFTNMPAEAGEQLRDWIRQHATQDKIEKKSAPARPPLRESASLNSRLPEVTAVRRSSATLLNFSMNVQALRRLQGFPSGVVTGVVVSALLAAVFLLGAHHREFGDSLIRLGERFGGRTWAESVPQKPQLVSPGTQIASPAPILVPQAESNVSEIPEATVKPRVVKLESVTSGTASALSASALSASALSASAVLAAPNALRAANALLAANVNAPGKSATSSPTPPQTSAPVIAVAPILDRGPDILPGVVPKVESVSQPDVHIDRSKEADSGSFSEKFLEVGSFNDKVWANRTTDKLSRLGFRSTVIQKRSFWKKSFHILVGPYGSDQEAEAAHKNLTSSGFTPRSFERGTRDFRFPPALKLDGTRIPVGDCVISWESYMPDAIVKIEDSRGVAVTAEGKWAKRDASHDPDAIVYRNNADGSRTLLELRFSSKGRILVFRKGTS